jgi:proliferating cell nuclear antigen
MEITIENPNTELFTSIFKDVRIFTENINISFESERFYIQSMDTAHVILFEIILLNKWFSKYEISTPTTLGINATTLYQILNTREKNQKIHIKYNTDENDDKLSVHFNSDTKVKGEYEKLFELPLVDIESDMLGIPEIENNVEIKMESSNFAKLINELQAFGDSIKIQCDVEKMILISENDDSKKMQINIATDDLDSFSINENSTIDLSFSLKYLHNICKYNKISKYIGLNFNQNLPMKIIYLLEDELERDDEDEENISLSNISFYLAPKIKDDD